MDVEISDYNLGLDSDPNGRSTNCSLGDFYTECTTTSGSSVVIMSTWLTAVAEILFNFISYLMRISLPYLWCGRSVTSVIPGILGPDFLAPRCVSWRHRQW